MLSFSGTKGQPSRRTATAVLCIRAKLIANYNRINARLNGKSEEATVEHAGTVFCATEKSKLFA